MPWIRFSVDYHFQVNRRSSISYRAGHRYLVSQACAEQALSEGKAVRAQRRKDQPRQQVDARR